MSAPWSCSASDGPVAGHTWEAYQPDILVDLYLAGASYRYRLMGVQGNTASYSFDAPGQFDPRIQQQLCDKMKTPPRPFTVNRPGG